MVNTIRQAKASNNPDLPIIAGGTNNGIPSEAYNDATFAKLINEAEKYLGYPYVFGGSSPSTSFDCSGFVCWVYTHSGYITCRERQRRGYITSVRGYRQAKQSREIWCFQGNV